MSSELEGLFSSLARVQVLRLFLLHPSQPFYQREIERETGQPIRAVQREVERMEGIGLLLRSLEGNRVFYRLNTGFPLLGELTALFERESGGPVEGGRGGPISSAEEAPSVKRQTSNAKRDTSEGTQPFPWLESPAAPPLPEALRRVQAAGEWDRAY